MSDRITEELPYRPPADNQPSLNEVFDRGVVARGLVSGLLVFPPLQVGCLELFVAAQRLLALPEFSNELGFVISIGVPLVFNALLFLLLMPATCFGICAKSGSLRSIYTGWAFTFSAVAIIQFFIMWSGSRFSKSFDTVGTSLFVTLLPSGITLVLCILLSRFSVRLVQFLVPGVAWSMLAIWLMT